MLTRAILAPLLLASASYANAQTKKLAEGFDYEVNGVEVTITRFTDEEATEFEIPGEVDGWPITGIGPNAFHSRRQLRRVTFPDTLKTIGEKAFMRCSGLEEIRLPESLEKLGAHAFQSCGSAIRLRLPSGLKTIPESAFSNCYKLPRVTFPPGLEEIGVNAFANARSFTIVNIPAGVRSVGRGAFFCCGGLTTISVAKENRHLTSTKGVLFGEGGKLLIQYPNGKEGEHYEIPDGVTEVGGTAFWDSKKLRSVTFPASLTKIGYSAFESCRDLRRLNFEGDAPELERSSIRSLVGYATVYHYEGAKGFEVDPFRLGEESPWEDFKIQAVARPRPFPTALVATVIGGLALAGTAWFSLFRKKPHP